jgi:hypothetical protein
MNELEEANLEIKLLKYELNALTKEYKEDFKKIQVSLAQEEAVSNRSDIGFYAAQCATKCNTRLEAYKDWNYEG